MQAVLYCLSADDVSDLKVFITGMTEIIIASKMIIARDSATLNGVIVAK